MFVKRICVFIFVRSYRIWLTGVRLLPTTNLFSISRSRSHIFINNYCYYIRQSSLYFLHMHRLSREVIPLLIYKYILFSYSKSSFSLSILFDYLFRRWPRTWITQTPDYSHFEVIFSFLQFINWALRRCICRLRITNIISSRVKDLLRQMQLEAMDWSDVNSGFWLYLPVFSYRFISNNSIGEVLVFIVNFFCITSPYWQMICGAAFMK